LTSFWTFSLSTWFLDYNPIPEHSLLSLMLLYTNKKSYLSLRKFVILFFLLFSLNFIIFKNPLIILLFISFLALIPVLQILLVHKKKTNLLIKLEKVLKPILELLKVIGFIDFIFFWYVFFNSFLSLKFFKTVTLIFSLLNVCYLFCGKYIFYLKIINEQVSFFLLFFLSFLSLGLILRLLTSFSFIFIPFIVKTYPLTLVEGFDLPEKEQNNSTNKPPFKGWFNTHNHHHYYPPEVPRSKWLTSLGYGLGFSSIFIGLYGCFQYHNANNIAYNALQEQREANKASLKQNNEFERQNDLECVDKGFMSEKTYCAKYSQDCVDFFKKAQETDERAARMLAAKKAGMPGIKVTNENNI